MSTQQMGQLLADGQTQPCSSIFAVGGAVCLFEGFEDVALFLLGDADTGVADPDRQIAFAGGSVFDGAEDDFDLTLLGELHCIGEEVLDDLTNFFAVRNDAFRCVR